MCAGMMRGVRAARGTAASLMAGRAAPRPVADWIVARKGTESGRWGQGAFGGTLVSMRPKANVLLAGPVAQALRRAAGAAAPLSTPARPLTPPPPVQTTHNTAARGIGRASSPPPASIGFWARSLTLLPDDGIAGIKGRFKMIMQEYGKVALLSHFTIWGASTAVVYVALEGMGMESIMAYLPDSISSHLDAKAGALAVAVVLTKLTGPLRLLIDIAITPTLAGYLRHTWLAGPLGLRKAADMVAMGQTGRYKDSYRVVGQLARPYADDGRRRAGIFAKKYFDRARTGYQAGKTRARTAAGRVLIWAGDIRKRRRTKHGGPGSGGEQKRSLF